MTTRPASRDPAAQVARLLLLHRAVIVVLMVVVAGLSLALLRGGSKEPPADTAPDREIPPLERVSSSDVVAVDLGRRVEEIARAGWPDGSETYFTSDEASVHMHVLGYRQQVPLHLHPDGMEATIVVTGSPEIHHVHGSGSGTLIRQGGVQPVGTLIYSPPGTGHKWVNHDAERMQGNLVFSVPPFGGNLYVDEDDPLLLGGGAPSIVTAQSLLERLPEDAAFRLEPLPILEDRMRALVLRGEAELPATSGQRVMYVARGRAALPAAGGSEVRAGYLLELPADRALRLRALEPTVAFVFDPAGR